MRILVISYSYYPANNPRSFRWSAICEYWAQNGITVDVVCAYAETGLSKSERLQGVNVYRSRDISQQVRATEPTNINAVASSKPCWQTNIKKLLYVVLKKITVLLRWPDFAWLWIPKAHREAKRLLKSHHYDGIYSVSPAFSSHVVALLLGRQRKNIPWISDYGDPFSLSKESPMNNNWLYSGLNKYIDRLVIRSSKKISVTTVETAKKYVAQLGALEKWVTVIPPLVKCGYFFPDDRQKSLVSQEGTINVIFAGTLYAAIRNPNFFLELLTKVRKKLLPRNVEIHFYGSVVDCMHEFESYKAAINDWIFLHGTVDQSELKHVYERADVLVNIGNVTTYQTPSKVIEYMSTGLPILNITSVADDSSIPLLQSYPAAISLYQGDGVTERLVDKVCAFLEQVQQVDIEDVNEILKQYKPETIANTYLSLLSYP